MHSLPHRQLPALLLSLLLANAAAADSPAPEQELQAARLIEATLRTRGITAEQLQKLAGLYAQLESKYPQMAEAKTAHAEVLWSLHESARALEKWAEAEKLTPHDAALLARIASAYMDSAEAAPAAEYFLKAADAAPAVAFHHFNAATFLHLFRNKLLISEARAMELAHEHFAHATRLAPENANYARAQAESFYVDLHPDWRAALAAWTHFLAISPDKDFALGHLARVHIFLGEAQEARACLAQIKSAKFDGLKAALELRLQALPQKNP